MRPTLPNTGPEKQSEQESLGKRFQEKLAESRFFALSLIIHTIIILIAGSIVIYKAAVAPDFESGVAIPPSEELPPPPEPLPEPPLPKQHTPPPPKMTGPTIESVSTTDPTSLFKAPPALPPVVIKFDRTDSIAIPSMLGTPDGTSLLPPSMTTRLPGFRDGAMKKTGGKLASEQAVMRGLEWLRLNQSADGSWGEKNKGAMTGLALLCFLGHGETYGSKQYGLTVNKAVQWFLDNGTKHQGRLHMGGQFGQHDVYEHAIGTYALGEYFSMTRDERVLELLKQAVDYIVKGQGPSGGWMYRYAKDKNDVSVSGWQIQALKAAHLTQINLPGVDDALEKSMRYLESMQGPQGGYGYQNTPADRYSLTGAGILCRLFWKGDRRELRKGMEWMLDQTESKFPVKYKGDHADLYAWYYHTQACLMFGGGAWTKWNKWFQDELVAAQSADGSWPIPGAKGIGPQSDATMTGAVYRTTLCILMLEVFYRYLPANQ